MSFEAVPHASQSVLPCGHGWDQHQPSVLHIGLAIMAGPLSFVIASLALLASLASLASLRLAMAASIALAAAKESAVTLLLIVGGEGAPPSCAGALPPRSAHPPQPAADISAI